MTVIKIKRAHAVVWETTNPILEAGEQGAEFPSGQIKVGDGIRHWNDLPYSGSGTVALQSHVDSLFPHPVYDDGPSLVLLYENAKV